MYDTFISYNSSDEAYAQTVYGFLESAGCSPFLAAVSLPIAGRADFGCAIDEALSEVDSFVLVTSTAENVTEGYVEAEWRVFVDEKRAGRKPGNIVTVLFGAIAVTDLPLALRQYQVLNWSDQGRQDLIRFLTPAKIPCYERPSPRATEGILLTMTESSDHTLSRIPASVERQIRQALPSSLRNAELTARIQGNRIRVSVGRKEIGVFMWEEGKRYKVFPACKIDETTITHAKPHVRGRTIKRPAQDSE